MTNEYEKESESDMRDIFQKPESVPVCKCLLDDQSSELTELPTRKLKILSAVSRTENYLADHRIHELTRFLFTKLMNQSSGTPLTYLQKLLDDCMLYRAGYGLAPVLYEDRHLKAIIKSFDPSNKGWLNIGQVHRVHEVLGLSMRELETNQISCNMVLEMLIKSQESDLLKLLSAGIEAHVSDVSASVSSIN